MGDSSKTSYTNSFSMRKPQDNLESKLDLALETMERLADRLERMEAKMDLSATDRLPWIERKMDLLQTKADRLQLIEAKMDFLATKADLQAVFMSLEGKLLPSKKPLASNPTGHAKKDLDEKDDKTVKTFSFPNGGSVGLRKTVSFADGGNGGPPKTFSLADGGSGGFPMTSNFGDMGSGGFSFGDGPFSSNLGKGGDDQTIIVKGFDSSLSEQNIKSTLSKYFSSCGEIISVVVPTNRLTGVAIGCAYIHLKEGVEKALKLSGSNLGSWNLLVEKASPVPKRDVGDGFGPPGGEGQWNFPYRCNGLGQCSFC